MLGIQIHTHIDTPTHTYTQLITHAYTHKLHIQTHVHTQTHAHTQTLKVLRSCIKPWIISGTVPLVAIAIYDWAIDIIVPGCSHTHYNYITRCNPYNIYNNQHSVTTT